MLDDMGIFRTTISVAALASPDRRRELADVMVDTGSEYNWVPRDLLIDLGVAPVRIDQFETADGRVLERDVGFVLLYAGGRSAPTVVVFAEHGDVVLLGAHGLEGLNMRVDLGRKELVPAGPVPAAARSLTAPAPTAAALRRTSAPPHRAPAPSTASRTETAGRPVQCRTPDASGPIHMEVC